MARGGKRKGAGAPLGNQNALKHGGRAKVKYGVPLDKVLSTFEYKALCMVQMATLKDLNEVGGGSGYSQYMYILHKRRYIGAIEFNERRNVSKATKFDREFLKYCDSALKIALKNITKQSKN
jgi:hypothetical protein